MTEEKIEAQKEQPETPTDEQVQVSTEDKATGANVAGELQELGRHLTAATKAALESPEAKEAGAQMQRGLESLSKTVNQLLTQARETKVGQKVETGVADAATSVKDRHVFETLADSVASALQTVNKTLGQAVEKAQVRAEEAKAKKSAPQQIEVVSTEDEAVTETAEENEE